MLRPINIVYELLEDSFKTFPGHTFYKIDFLKHKYFLPGTRTCGLHAWNHQYRNAKNGLLLGI